MSPLSAIERHLFLVSTGILLWKKAIMKGISYWLLRGFLSLQESGHERHLFLITQRISFLTGKWSWKASLTDYSEDFFLDRKVVMKGTSYWLLRGFLSWQEKGNERHFLLITQRISFVTGKWSWKASLTDYWEDLFSRDRENGNERQIFLILLLWNESGHKRHLFSHPAVQKCQMFSARKTS